MDRARFRVRTNLGLWRLHGHGAGHTLCVDRARQSRKASRISSVRVGRWQKRPFGSMSVGHQDDPSDRWRRFLPGPGISKSRSPWQREALPQCGKAHISLQRASVLLSRSCQLNVHWCVPKQVKLSSLGLHAALCFRVTRLLVYTTSLGS